MFTGLVQGKGTLLAKMSKGSDVLLEVALPFAATDVSLGESIAVNGACLTVEKSGPSSFGAFVSAETARSTTLSSLPVGAHVNVERALRVGDRLGGHLVTGHIDTVGKVTGKRHKDGSLLLDVGVDVVFSRYLVSKGSVTLDGVSLTVNGCGEGVFSVNVIPITAQATTLGEKINGAVLNVEFDILSKYVEALLKFGPDGARSGLDANFLAKYGFA